MVSVEFKCERCGKIFHRRDDQSGIDSRDVLLKILRDNKNVTDKIGVHDCEDGAFGVATLIGAKLSS